MNRSRLALWAALVALASAGCRKDDPPRMKNAPPAPGAANGTIHLKKGDKPVGN